MFHPKRPKLSNENPEFNDFQKALEEIEVYQTEVEELQEKSVQEVLKIEQRLDNEKRPIFARREEAIQRIPNFWVTALINHPEMAALLHESEEEYLVSLDRIEVQTFEDLKGSFKIIFHFDENAYFENAFLSKEFIHTVSDGKQTRLITHTPIIWKEGQNIFDRIKDRKCFFHWLTTSSPGQDVSDMEIAQAIKDDLWTNPLQYYLLADTENDNDENSDEDEDVLFIEDSEDEDEDEEEEQEEETDNENEDYESPSSSEIQPDSNAR